MIDRADHVLLAVVMLASAAALVGVLAAPLRAESASLAGSWRFCMNGPEPGAAQQPLPADLSFNDTIELPGTTETRRKGSPQPPGTGPAGQLTRVYTFEGPAWYQREVTIPESWRGKRVTLSLERTKSAQVWLDEDPVGQSPILCTPHEYALGVVPPGEHTLTIMVDNRRRPVAGDNHQLSGNTQGNWNGIIGRIELRATDPVWLEEVQLNPDASRRTVEVTVRLGNAGQPAGSGTLSTPGDRRQRVHVVAGGPGFGRRAVVAAHVGRAAGPARRR